MKPMDLSGLIKGLLVVIGIAVAMGKLDDLKRWAIKGAFAPYHVVHHYHHTTSSHHCDK